MSEFYRRPSADRKAQRMTMRNRGLLEDGLARIRMGLAPTKAQRPHVQRYLSEYLDEVQQLRKIADDYRIENERAKRLYDRLVFRWDAMINVLYHEFDIELYEGKDSHGWYSAGGDKEEYGFPSPADALRSALAWRLGQGKEKPNDPH